MGNKSRRTPNHLAAPSPPPRRTEPPRFAVVRTEVDEIKIVNVAQIAIARFTLLGGGKPFLTLETVADHLAASFETRGGTFDPEEFHGDAARDLAAHLILCGIDVQGAREALVRSRGDLYAAYFGPARRDAGKAFDDVGGGCACLTPPPAEPPPEENEDNNSDVGEAFENLAAAIARSEGAISSNERQRAEDETRREANEAAARAAFEVARRKARERARLSEEHRAEEMNDETREACAFGANCKRFPRCGDCSLYALDKAAEPAEPLHVEEVAGETRAQLEARRDACAVYRGIVSSGVVGKFCGVGHEMSDPACALCRFLRVYSPS